MSLTDPKLLFLLAGLSLVAFFLIIYFWRRLSERKVSLVIVRGLSLLTLNILVVATLGVGLNNYGQFYTSWSELFGERNATPLVVDRLSGEITFTDLKRAKYSPDGSAIIHRLIRGEMAGITGDFFIALPPSFVNSLKSGQKPRSDYPVAEFFSGYPGHPSAWIHGMRMVDRLDQASSDKKLPEVVSIYPNINLIPKFDAECMNIPGGPQMETWLSQDIVKYVNTWLGLQPNAWVTFGYSTGGWCSTMLALRHPTQFKAAASIASYYIPLVDKHISDVNKSYLIKEYDLYSLIAKQAPSVNLFVLNSVDDKFSHNATMAFLKRIKAPISVTEVELAGVGHNFNAWKKILPGMIDWYSVQLSGKSNL